MIDIYDSHYFQYMSVFYSNQVNQSSLLTTFIRTGFRAIH